MQSESSPQTALCEASFPIAFLLTTTKVGVQSRWESTRVRLFSTSQFTLF